ncbi:tRNA1(Val) (adenine(37)-N6)-methyltransferase [Spirabiliibacterium falconis]|uniref:tRNA1(Val) (adenine(37)-N6)-methyltransferase n=1 Tax=Spirabiliibacterium falconis TaxID=572023 RepID=UPI001AADE65F|nr:methyltransferase [Spirabiliibacterium falconis]MBE2893603.1 methyltransferase [Spirabiliibacterium falconis]
MGFQFKQFYIQDDHCAMKVGTDSILLGSWVGLEAVQTVLDMGCGCGILSLMLAQRLQQQPHFMISALEIERNAYQQACDNILQSPWAQHIAVFHDDVAAFANKNTQQFDLIVANPPYFPAGIACRAQARDTARYVGHSALRSHLDWLLCAKTMLRCSGAIALVLPYDAGLKLLTQSAVHQLHCIERVDVATTVQKSPSRMLLRFAMQPKACIHRALVIHAGDDYSADYRQLTRAFYLRF